MVAKSDIQRDHIKKNYGGIISTMHVIQTN